MAAPCLPRAPRFGPHFIFRRVLHTDTAAAELRALLANEWATISVVAGLFVLLSGAAASSAPAAVGGEVAGAGAARFVFLFAHALAYIGSASSCLAALFLLHTSNTVPAHRLHDFLVRSHSLLWVPMGGICFAVLCTSAGNLAATLVIYGSYAAFGARVGIAAAWLALVGAALAALSHGPRWPRARARPSARRTRPTTPPRRRAARATRARRGAAVRAARARAAAGTRAASPCA